MKQTRKQGLGSTHRRVAWEADRRHSSMCVGKGKDAFSPDMVLWADSATGAILATDILRPEDPPEAILASLRRALESPVISQGLPARPEVVCMAKPELAEVLRPEVEALGAEVEVVPVLPALDEAYEAMEAQFGSPANQGYLEKTQVPEPVLADLFAAAAEYYRLKPWKILPDSETVLLLCDAWDPPHRYAVILGAGGETLGFGLYHSWGGLHRVRSGDREKALQVPAESVIFEKVSNMGPSRVAEMREHQWELATRNAYPVVMVIRPKSQLFWPTEDDARVLTVAARVLGPWVRTLNKPRWLPEGQHWIEETFRVTAAGEDVDVTASYPAPRTPKRRLPPR